MVSSKRERVAGGSGPASTRRVARLLLAGSVFALSMIAACTTGVGEGEITGVVSAPSCGIDAADAFDLAPDYFVAEAFGDTLNLRLQSSSDEIDYSNLVYVTVNDAKDVAENQIGVALEVGDALASPVRMSLLLNESCDFHDRTSIPVSFQSVSGTITFSAIYAPDVSDARLIEATFENVRFEDPADPATRYAVLSGTFSFLYSRGRPAQVFP